MPSPGALAKQDPPRPRRPTMVDVAREAGVALRTVSRVVNGDATVGEELARRVRAAVDQLDYQPDERARQLRSGRTGTIGAAVRNIAIDHPVLRAVEEAARAARLNVVAMSTEDDEAREREAVMSMCRRRMDGIIIEPIAEDHGFLQAEIDSGLAVVAFDRPAAGVSVDTVVTDNRGGVRQAFDHLVRHGHRRIGYIGDDERIHTGRERADAFRDCLRGIGAPLDGMVHPGPIEPGRIAAALASLRDGGGGGGAGGGAGGGGAGGRGGAGGGDHGPVTAIVTGNSSTTFEVIRRLGSDFGALALVGFDDFTLADLLRPGVTVVAQGDQEIGRTAIGLFQDRLADPARPVRTVTVPTTLIARGSGELPP